MIVASYKENPKVKLQAGESADWWAYHTGPVIYDRHQRHQPRRWHAKVLACTDPAATARQVIEWYEVRWHIETFFRELKSRLQLGCYVLMRFEAVERYLDLFARLCPAPAPANPPATEDQPLAAEPTCER